MPGVLIYWFLYMGFYCIVYQVSNKRSYQSTGSYIRVFSVLSARCHTKGPTNLQVLIYGIFLLGIHQEDLVCTSTTTANHYLATLWDNSRRVQKYAGRLDTKRICWYGQPTQMMPKCCRTFLS